MLKLLDGIVELIENLRECEWCRDIGKYEYSVYNPFDDEPNELILCETCSEYSYESFELCEGCCRNIWNNSGYRKNIRYDDNAIYCVKCLQDEWFNKGMKEFKDGDWFDDVDLLKNKFIKHSNYFCCSKQSYKDAEKVFKELQDKGNRVIVSITSSGMGFEHFFDIWIKPIESTEVIKKTIRNLTLH